MLKIDINKFRKNKKSGLSKPLLVLMSDGFGLLAAIIEVNNKTKIIVSARSTLSDPFSALMEVAGKMTFSAGGKLPKEAIVLHAHAIPSILELPIENVDALEKSKLQELVRWEMESIFSDLVPRDNLGWLLVGLGYLSEGQRDVLIRTLESENAGNNKKVRIGELAIREGYIDREQLEECLKVQDQLQLQDQRIKCGWSPLINSNTVRWIATAINNGIHEQWVSAFKSVSSKGTFGKVNLDKFYPYIGTSAIQISDVYANEECYVLELHQPYLALMTFREGCLLQCFSLECSGNTPHLGDVETLLHSYEIPEESEVYLLVSSADRNPLREELEQSLLYKFKLLERELVLPASVSGDISSAESVMIAGAAMNYTSNSHQLIVPVQGQEPPPPLYKRTEFKIASSVLAFAILLGGIESVLAWKVDKLEVKLDAVEERLNRQELVKKDMRASKKAQQRLEEVNYEYNELIALKGLMESVLVTRQKFTSEFLDIVTRNLNDNLVINSIEELEWNKFVIDGWALDQPSIDYYGQELSRDLKKWSMIIAENPSSLGRNTAGLTGYNFKFVLQKKPTGLIQHATNSSFTQRKKR
ncbi:MAG: hypothetical protein HND53_00215 [Proteobacteria bacterium]|nr:hypothetical protein [Pseudomonadota bacterium]NOG58898.1 hypothetical protein [Pseudomonadota bacterium]